jgi:hypothetical protein
MDTKQVCRLAFEDEALIYLPSEDGREWYKVSQCVWSCAARLRGRVSINDEYERLETLFVELLGVQPVDLLMAIDELKETGNNRSVSEQEVKDSIWTVNSLLSHDSDPPSPRDVGKHRIFPVQHPNGAVKICSTAIEFFIVDREPLRRMFNGKIKTLAFTLEEVVQLRPFIHWAGMEPLYLSRCVREVTSFHDGLTRQIFDSKHQIQNRAHALLRLVF